MLQLWLIAMVGALYLHDDLRSGGAPRAVVELSGESIALALTPYLALALVTHLVCWACGREVDRRGSMRAVMTAERVLEASRFLAIVTYMIGVFSLGWVEQVRAVVGDLILVDEIIVLLPPLLLFAAGWWSFYPIEQRLRNAVWVRVLEDGHPAYPTPSRWRFVWTNIRHQILFMLVPLLLILGLTEMLSWGETKLRRHQFDGGVIGGLGAWVWSSPAFAEWVFDAVRFAGVAVVFVFTPLLMRFVWDAIPLGQGQLRDRLMRVCSQAGVKIRELLVWRTHGTMLNGLAMGVVGPLRYIMLTDALLDNLPQRQVESVMAHEVGHAKHHHIPWMVLGLVALGGAAKVVVLAAMLLLGLGLQTLLPDLASQRGLVAQLLELIGGGGELAVLVGAIFMFGFVSRRFEWQADAFAAKQLSKDDPASPTVTPEAAGAMCEALDSVARLNHIPRNRRSFRHGSMATRQNRLVRLVGTPLNRLPIDRTVRWIKGGIVVGLLVALVGAFVEVRPMAVMHPIYEQEMMTPRFMRTWPQSTLEDAP